MELNKNWCKLICNNAQKIEQCEKNCQECMDYKILSNLIEQERNRIIKEIYSYFIASGTFVKNNCLLISIKDIENIKDRIMENELK